MRKYALAAFGLVLASSAQAADKYTWDGYGNGAGKCPIYGMHIELVAESGHVVGWWLQKDRVVRNFDLPLGGDGNFTGTVSLGTGDMKVTGSVGASPEIKLHGYCDFGGPLKKAAS